jgi:hypothetical protein
MPKSTVKKKSKEPPIEKRYKIEGLTTEEALQKAMRHKPAPKKK